ncbi:CapA family protein [Propionicicella superfundia]|uniref:CapA family protein n=1 Tax=Propionicicella superfundia TaxID=348582 RepID=UPI0006891212|nr:CapA family protein [Propionicicella superfundia]
MRRLAVSVIALALVAGCARVVQPQPGTPSDISSATTSPTVVSSSPAATPPVTPTAAARVVTTAMSGDLLWHDTLWKGPAADAERNRTGTDFDFAPLFAGIRPVVAGADFAVCHEEVPFAKEGGPYTGYPSFAAPPQIAQGVRDVGWDACTTSSNHSLDQGFSGLGRTLAAFDEAGVLHTGTFRSQAERNTPMIYTTTSGVRIAVVSGTYDLNGIPLPAGKPWSVAMWDVADMLARAKQAREAGADIVLAALHGGDEYSSTENEEQRERARALTASPYIDLVYGHHVHVVQPWTKMNGKWVVYGLGNLIAQHKREVVRGYEGVVARFTWTEQPDGTFTVTKAEYIPTYVSHWTPETSARVYVVSTALARGQDDRQRLLDAQRRTRAVVRAYNPQGLAEG